MKKLVNLADEIGNLIHPILEKHDVNYHVILLDQAGFVVEGSMPSEQALQCIAVLLREDREIKNGKITIN